MVRLGLNSGTDVGGFAGLSTRWLTGSEGAFGGDAAFADALAASVRLALVTTAVAVPLGLMYAVGTISPPLRARPRLAAFVRSLPLVGAVIPSVLVGTVFVAGSATVFDSLFGLGSRGATVQLVGHVTIATALVALIARSQLTSGTAALIEVARDLGAPRWRATLFVIGPTLLPGALVGAVVAFAASLDDLAVSRLVIAAGIPGAEQTAPVELYDATLRGPTPAVFAAATVLVAIVVAAIAVVAVALVALRRRDDVPATATFGVVRTGLGR
jgi:ABC-type spermidine/putrescine transport system permease subunit II